MATRQKTSSTKSTRKQPAAKRSTSSRATKTTKTAKSTKTSRAAAPQPGVLRHLVDGHGHDLWGVAVLILAVLPALNRLPADSALHVSDFIISISGIGIARSNPRAG